MTISEKYTQFKHHVSEHKEAYIFGTTGLVVGGILGGAAMSNVQVVQIVDAMKIQFWSPTTNIVIAALGDPGNVVQSLDTKEVWASQGAAARALGVAPSHIAQHLNGLRDSVGGHHLKILGKAGFPVEPIA